MEDEELREFDFEDCIDVGDIKGLIARIRDFLLEEEMNDKIDEFLLPDEIENPNEW